MLMPKVKINRVRQTKIRPMARADSEKFEIACLFVTFSIVSHRWRRIGFSLLLRC